MQMVLDSMPKELSSFWKEESPKGEVVGKKRHLHYFTYHPGLKATPPSMKEGSSMPQENQGAVPCCLKREVGEDVLSGILTFGTPSMFNHL